MTRTDAHRPSVIEPSDYFFIGAYYTGNSDDMWDAYGEDHRYLMDTVGLSEQDIWPEGPASGKCDHCGQRFAHGVLYRYRYTSEIIRVGHICAAETLSLPHRAALVRKRAEDRARAARERREAIASQREDVREAYEAFKAEGAEALWDNLRGSYGGFIADLHSKVGKWTLSDRQADAYVKGYRSAQERQEPQERKPRGQALEGRQVVTGTTVATKDYYNDFGGYVASTVVIEQGDTEVVAWVKHTSTWQGVKGEQTTFKATFEPQDEGFSFGKRATTKGL